MPETWRARIGPEGDPIVEPTPPPVTLQGQIALPPRYVDLGHLASGGLGEVRRVRDEKLGITLVMKLHRRRATPIQRSRFEREARLTARLHHPNIVAALDLGRLENGTPWFTMPEVRGRTLRHVIDEHLIDRQHDDAQLRRLLELVQGVARALAYAHSEGVVHRDIKPQNLMVGRFGDVRIMDFGVAMDLTHPNLELDDAVVGTPLYMSPEQARGEAERCGPPIDAYALGVILYEILTGNVPYEGDGIQVWHQIITGPPPDPAKNLREGRSPREGLLEVVRSAIQVNPAARPDASAIAGRLQSWLDGEQRRKRARSLVAATEPMVDELAGLRRRAEEQRALALGVLEPLPSHAPATAKAAGWLLEDEATKADLECRRVEARYLQQLRVALNQDPECPEAHERLAAYHRDALQSAEAEHDGAGQVEHEELLIAHDRGEHAAFLLGRSALTLHTDPPGAAVVAQRLVHRGRRWQVTDNLPLGRTPLEKVQLPHGNWRLLIRAAGRVEVVYPVRLSRGEHWDGVGPDDPNPHPIHLPRELLPDEVYVPAGWYRTGGDSEALDPLPNASVWVPGFAIGRFHVTVTLFEQFLEALGETASQWVPLANPGEAKLGYAWDGGSWKALRESDQNAPITLITPFTASAYAQWKSRETGHAWRLPHELEWEKAARGADRRHYPWGNGFDPSLGAVLQSLDGQPRLSAVGHFPTDASVYGVRDLAGNTRDITATLYDDPLPTAVSPIEIPVDGDPWVLTRGGFFASAAGNCRSANRFVLRARSGVRVCSFRLVRSLP